MVGLTDALEYVGATKQHNLGVKVLSDVHVALRDGLESRVIDATHWPPFLRSWTGTVQYLRAAEALGALRDVGWQLVRLLLDVTANLALSGGDGVATLGQDRHQLSQAPMAAEKTC